MWYACPTLQNHWLYVSFDDKAFPRLPVGFVQPPLKSYLQ